MKQESVSICMIITGDDPFYQTVYVIENLIAKTNITGSIYVYLSNKVGPQMTAYLSEKEIVKEIVKEGPEETFSIARAKNQLAYRAKEKYVCFFPENVIVNVFWAEALIEAYCNFCNPGLVGIKKDTDLLFYNPILKHHPTGDDYLENVLLSGNNTVDGVCIIEANKLKEHGLFDENSPCETLNSYRLCYNLGQAGFNNFYIRPQVCLELPKKPEKHHENLLEIKSKYLASMMNQSEQEIH